MNDDEAIIEIARREFEEGRDSLERSGFHGAKVTVNSLHWDAVSVELKGRFARRPDRELWASVEVDPARVGWRLEADLYEFLDSEKSPRLVRNLGASRVGELDYAKQSARRLATAAWVALREYLEEVNP